MRRSGANRSKQPRATRLIGYHSRVCSSTGDAIERIAAAIDQLASDARDADGMRGAAGQRELSRRVARLWQMVSDLDPELARRARRYTAPADGAPADGGAPVARTAVDTTTFLWTTSYLWKALWIRQPAVVNYAPVTSMPTEAVTSGCSRIWTL
jgi:hypothetical protein